MEINLIVLAKGQPQAEISAMIVDGPASWAEIAALSNENGEISLPVEGAGEYKVKLFAPSGEHIITAATGKQNHVELTKL